MSDKFVNGTGLGAIRDWVLSKIDSLAARVSANETAIASKVSTTDYATANTYGIVKLNPPESIDMNANGQLTVGGRLGQFPNGGLYYPTSAGPVNVGNYSLIISEAKGLSGAHREFVIAGGTNVTCKSAAAGSTQYRVSNTQNNRFLCSCFKGGRLAVSEAEAANKTVAITSVKYANGNDCVPYFGATESSNDIIITVEETLNPSSAITSIRGYGTWTNADIMSAGQGNRVEGGKHVQVGQAQHAVGNQMVLAGIRNYSSGNNSIVVGSDNINLGKTFVALFGQGHDTTNGGNGVCAVGMWSQIDANTAFAVGNGTAYNARSNLFEIKSDGSVVMKSFEITSDGGVVMKSPDGNRWKVTVDNNGNLTTTAAS